MNTDQLSDNHRRIISSRVQMIERKIIEIEEMLMESSKPLLDQVIEPLTTEETDKMIDQLHIIQSILADLSEHYWLKLYKKSQRAMILTRLSHMLDISEDMYAEKLKGYGSFNPELKEDYNNDILHLEKAIRQTFEPFNDI